MKFLMFSVIAQLVASVAWAGEYVFKPTGSEFSVTFPEKPAIVPSNQTSADGTKHTITRAELKGKNWILKAEVTPIPSGSAEAMTDEDVIAGAQRYSEFNGLSYPDITLVPSEIGRCVNLRAFKDIGGTKATYENRLCYGDTSLIILYVASPSKKYPPDEAISFFKSLKRL